MVISLSHSDRMAGGIGVDVIWLKNMVSALIKYFFQMPIGTEPLQFNLATCTKMNRSNAFHNIPVYIFDCPFGTLCCQFLWIVHC